MWVELKKLFEANPVFRDKLKFPPCESRLESLIKQRYGMVWYGISSVFFLFLFIYCTYVRVFFNYPLT